MIGKSLRKIGYKSPLCLSSLGLLLFALLFILTENVPSLKKMAVIIEENNIDVSDYFYTDVKQVEEAEMYLREKLIQN